MENNDLAVPILDALSNLNLKQDVLSEVIIVSLCYVHSEIDVDSLN